MKASDVRFALFSLLVLVAVAGPAPIRLPGPKVPRGVGCGGGSKPVVPKFEPPKFKPPVGGHVSEAVDAVDAVAPRLEQTASARALEAVPAEVAKKDVAGLQNAARKALEQPNLPAEVKKPLQALLKETEEMVPLQRLLKSLESGDAHALGTLSKEALPGDLRHQLDVAESLEELARILDNPKAAQAPWEAAGKPLGRLTGQARGPEVEEVRVGLALRECG